MGLSFGVTFSLKKWVHDRRQRGGKKKSDTALNLGVY